MFGSLIPLEALVPVLTSGSGNLACFAGLIKHFLFVQPQVFQRMARRPIRDVSRPEAPSSLIDRAGLKQSSLLTWPLKLLPRGRCINDWPKSRSDQSRPAVSQAAFGNGERPTRSRKLDRADAAKNNLSNVIANVRRN